MALYLLSQKWHDKAKSMPWQAERIKLQPVHNRNRLIPRDKLHGSSSTCINVCVALALSVWQQ